MIQHKLKLKYERSIIESHRSIFNELKTIISTYSYTTKTEKLKKHYPLVYGLTYDRIIKKYKPYKRPVSCSLLSTEITKQIEEYINTAERRLNWISLLGSDIETSLRYRKLGIDIPLPTMYAHTIVKYNNSQISKIFPDLEHTNYDVIYKIKTENFHLCADISKKLMCNFILICCVNSTKIYHIMFYFDKDYTDYPTEVYYNEEYIKGQFTNPL